MALTHLEATASIDELDLPMRTYNALCRNGIRTIGALVELTERDFLRMRGVGTTSLRDLQIRLALIGLSIGAEPPPPPDPEVVAEAKWIGDQLDAIAQDRRYQSFQGQAKIERRRFAWKAYRWATGRIEDSMPDTTERGAAFEVYALPGTLDLHLEGLNRLAHEELDA